MANRIAAVLREALATAGISQGELARRLKTDRANVSRWLSENYQGHTVATLERIAEALEVELEISFKPRSG